MLPLRLILLPPSNNRAGGRLLDTVSGTLVKLESSKAVLSTSLYLTSTTLGTSSCLCSAGFRLIVSWVLGVMGWSGLVSLYALSEIRLPSTMILVRGWAETVQG